MIHTSSQGALIERYYEEVKKAERVICAERFRLITEFYKENEGLPIIIKRAKALQYVLNRMQVRINPDELIAGDFTEELRGAPLFPEYSCDWLVTDIDSFDNRAQFRFKVPQEIKEEIGQLIPYWRGRTVADRVRMLIPEDVRKGYDFKVFDLARMGAGMGHHVANYKKVLKRGFNAIMADIEARRAALDLTNPEDYTIALFYDAAIIVCKAAIDFAKRYAVQAARMSMEELDLHRRKRLEELAQVCERVPASPAVTFRDALQSVWFTFLIHQLESNGGAQALGRIDQYLFPYYRNDIERGISTRDQVENMLMHFFLKIYTVCKLYSNEGAEWHGGEGVWGKCMTLGGVTRANQDATNELSYLCLGVATKLSLPQPDIAVALSDRTSDDFVVKVIKALKTNSGTIKLFNNDVVVSALLSLGASIEDARDWASLGCADPAIQGCMNTEADGGPFNLAKCLELALYDGVDPSTGVRLMPSLGGAEEITSMDEFKQKYKRVLEFFVREYVIASNIVDFVHMQLAPTPFLSTITDDCIEIGLDFTEGGARYNIGCTPVATGLATVADSIAAVEKVVFDQGLLTMKELKAILREDFEGREDLRLTLLNNAPKYGNDDDAVDDLANWVFTTFNNLLREYRAPRGRRCPYVGAWYPMTSHIPCGKIVGATPDGRRAHQPLSDNVSPVWGRNVRGPTALLKSTGKLDHARGYGSILNMTLNPSLFGSEDSVARLLGFIRAWLDLDIWHIQFNVITAETLRDAQRYPEKYPNLLVRVAGFSAYFTDLSKELQDNIIQRTEYLI